jgi:hypothetical protein
LVSTNTPFLPNYPLYRIDRNESRIYDFLQEGHLCFREAKMADKRINQSSDSQAEEDREEGRRESEEAEQKDLNQGMDTGTHDSTRHGVEWGASYRTKKRKSGK